MTVLRPPVRSPVTFQAPEVLAKTVAVSISHDTIRKLLVEALREEGYTVYEVAHGSAAEELARLKPDALLLEIGPWAEHVALLDTLRSDPQTSRTAVVTLALAAEHRAETQASGNVHTALPMPFELQSLFQALEEATARRPAEVRTVAQPLEQDDTFRRAADTLSVAERAIMVQWVQVARMTPPFAGRPDITPQPFLNALPRVLNMVVLGLRHQAAPEPLDAPSETTQRIRHHASLRFKDGLPIDACAREYHILGEILWQHLLRSTPAEEAVAVLPKLMGLVDECVRIAVSEFNRLAVEGAQRAAVRAG